MVWVSDVNGMLGEIKNKHIDFNRVIENESILTITDKTDDSLVLICPRSCYSYSKTGKTAVPVRLVDERKIADNFRLLAMNNGDSVFTIDRGGCSNINFKDNRVKNIIPIPGFFKEITHQKITFANNHIYYTDGITLDQFTRDGKLASSFIINEPEQKNKGADIINAIIADNYGIVWLATNNGLIKIDNYKYQFDKYSSGSAYKHISHNYVRSLYTDTEGNLWVGMRNGMINKLAYNKHDSQYTFYRSYNLHISHFITSEYTINCMLQLRDGTLLAGGQNGLMCVNKNDGDHFAYYLPGVISDSITEIWSIYEDAKGYIWMGTNGHGLFVYNPSTRKTWRYTKDSLNAHSIPGDAIWNIYRSKTGDIWLGANNGLCRVSPDYQAQNIRFERFALKGTEPLQVWSFAETDSNLWIGTTGNGIYSISSRTNKVSNYNDLPNNVISSIFFDKNGTLWAGTVNGLYHFNKQMQLINSFDEQDGLPSSDFNFKACAKTPDGKVFLGTKSGITGFYPEKIQSRDYCNVPVYITSLRISGLDSSSAIANAGSVKLNYKQNVINIGFAILEFSKLSSHTYRYKLEGAEDNWTYTTPAQPYANYTNVAPGKYKFILEGSANGNEWSKNRAELDIDIYPAIWQRPAFWIIIIAAIVFLIFIIAYSKVRYVIKTEREKNRIQLEIATLELNALQAQMNPHFIFNTLNSIQHYIVNHDVIAANDYLSKFAKLMRLFLESSKNRYTGLDTELDLIELYISFEKLRFEDKFDYVITIDDKLPQHNIKIPPMLIQPFVENAVKHGLVRKTKKGMLRLSFRSVEDGKYVYCSIDDDGIGRRKSGAINAAKNTTHLSRGMQLMEERIRTYNFIEQRKINIVITDKLPPDEGTIVELTIPVS